MNDHMTREAFETFVREINAQIPSPLSLDRHGDSYADLGTRAAFTFWRAAVDWTMETFE